MRYLPHIETPHWPLNVYLTSYSGIWSGVVIIVTPIDSHVGINLSRSIMLLAPRYNIGLKLRSFAIWLNCLIGDSICLPVANQKSSSHTQKSSSLCVAMACLSVVIILSNVSNLVPILFKYSAIGFVVVLSSNVMSVNVGADICVKLSVS